MGKNRFGRVELGDRTRQHPAAKRAFWRYDGDAPVVAAGCIAALAACLALVGLGSDAYRNVLGITRPIATTLVVVSAGFAGWLLLVRESWIPVGASGLKGFRLAALAGLALPLPAIAVDCLGGFGPDINAAAPDSLLFYPSIAVVAEFAFHITPLAITAVLAVMVRSGARIFEVAGLIVAAAIEPAFQVFWGTPDAPWWASAFVGLHVLIFNVLAVFLLRRFGLARVFVYRASYYLVWHVAWGHVRVELLFSG